MFSAKIPCTEHFVQYPEVYAPEEGCAEEVRRLFRVQKFH